MENLEEIRKRNLRKKQSNDLLSSSLDDLKRQAEMESHNLDDEIMSMDDSWEDYKRKYEDSLKVVKPRVIPIGQEIITTSKLMNIMEQAKYLTNTEFNIETIEGIKNSVSDIQIVVAVGPDCRQIKEGDKVKIRMQDFSRVMNPNSVHRKEVFELPLENINNRDYLSMHERNVKYIYKK